MIISFQQTTKLEESARLTFTNMREYYEEFGVAWDTKMITEQIQNLQNWDILESNDVVGALRLEVIGNDVGFVTCKLSPHFKVWVSGVLLSNNQLPKP